MPRAPWLVSLTLLSGCPLFKDQERVDPEPSASAAESPVPAAAKTVSATASAIAAPAPVNAGESVTIPAGTLLAGSRCFDVPRVRPAELENEEMSLGGFSIDKYPYPNELGKAALTGVTRDEAAKKCAERGRRLCSELEWERACKGPKNTTYPWGQGFKTGVCNGLPDGLIGKRPECKTEFGVMDMLGLAMEWTSSNWERGTPSGDAVIRGARDAKVSWLSARCTHARKRAPGEKLDEVGFRCCSGPENSAKVVMQPKKAATMEKYSDIDVALEMSLMRAMPRDHRGITDIELSFDPVYRWHPVAGEEMTVARWVAKPKNGPALYEVAVFKFCGEKAWRAATMRGPVEELSDPKESTDPKKLSFEVSHGGQTGTVTIGYWNGSVKLTQPDWIKEGNGFGSQPAVAASAGK